MKKKEIDFGKKTAARSRGRRPVLLAAAAAVFLGLASFLLIMIKNDFDFSRFLGARDPVEETSAGDAQTTAAPEETAAPFSDADTVNVLFYCFTDGSPSFFELVIFSEKENTIRVKPLAMDGVCVREGREYTTAGLYETFGVSALKTALAEKNYRVHRCVGFSETNFKRLLQKLGEVRVNVPRDVDFRADAITYSLSAGVQELKPDVLLQYMKHAYTGDDKLKAEGAAFAEILRAHLTADNVERGEAFFSELVNLAQTDISMFDYAGFHTRLAEFLAASPAVSVIS